MNILPAVFLTGFFLVLSPKLHYASDTVYFGRGSGYEPVSVLDYPEFDEVYSTPREVEIFAEFEEKTAFFRKQDQEYTVEDSETIFVSCREYEFPDSRLFLTHIIIKDPSQIHMGLSHDMFGGERELPTDYAARTGDVVVVNGSYFYYDTGKPIDICAPVVVCDGAVMRDGITNGSEVCLRFDGSFFSPHPMVAFSGEDLISFGVISNMGTADPLLIQDSTPMSFPAGTGMGTYPRTGLGEVYPGEYYIITAGRDASYSGGLTYFQMQSILFKLGCAYARSLDGGGSAALVINGELKNIPAEGKERAVVDFLGFSR